MSVASSLPPLAPRHPTRARWKGVSTALLAGLASVLAVGPGGAHPALLAAPVGPAGPLATFGSRIRDEQGGQVLLRGVNVNSLVQYAPSHPEAVALGQGQVRLMAAMGFDVIRLALSLSALEPDPGVISNTYLNRIARIVQRAEKQGLYVILDLHQDRYSAGLFPGESDGMPAFMVRTDGLRTRPILFGITDPAVQAAFTAFWHNQTVRGRGLQAWYFIGLSALARRFAGDPAIAGYDVMNEPNPGFILSGFVSHYLLPFYRQAIRAIRATGARQPILLEPDIFSMELGDPRWPPTGFSPSLEDAIFAPHLYATAIAGGSASGLGETAAAADLTAQAREALGQAQHLSVPWFIGEYGAGPGPMGNAQIAQDQRLADRYQVGSAYWLWSIRPGTYPWNLVTPAGRLFQSATRLALVAAPYPPVVGGRLHQLAYDPSARLLTARVAGVASDGPTVLVWNSLTYPSGARLQATRPYVLTSTEVRAGPAVITAWRAVFRPASGPLALRLSPAPAP
jgi:endoglycosylceramidase